MPPLLKRYINYRNISPINVLNFRSDLRSSICTNNAHVTNLTETLSYLINKYATLRKKLVRISHSHWFNDDTINPKKI